MDSAKDGGGDLLCTRWMIVRMREISAQQKSFEKIKVDLACIEALKRMDELKSRVEVELGRAGDLQAS